MQQNFRILDRDLGWNSLMTVAAILVVTLLLTPIPASSHGGRTNSEGCHNNRKTGDYHCHNSGQRRVSRKAPASSNSCGQRKTCGEMSNCREAMYRLNTCGNSRLDRDKDGIPCESICGSGSRVKSKNGSAKAITISKKTRTIPTYDRKTWPHWVDQDRDCQNTRAEILIRDSLEPVKFKRNKGCSVSWGKWFGPYTGKVFTKASDIDIDHIVPLGHAHKVGGANWSRAQKRRFANDFANLISVDDSTNQAKGSKSPARWKPPRREYWCTYASKWRRIKRKYSLTISVPEERSLRVMEKECASN
jgi:hypothetical protein